MNCYGQMLFKKVPQLIISQLRIKFISQNHSSMENTEQMASWAVNHAYSG